VHEKLRKFRVVLASLTLKEMARETEEWRNKKSSWKCRQRERERDRLKDRRAEAKTRKEASREKEKQKG
jgi:hypothetical protein